MEYCSTKTYVAGGARAEHVEEAEFQSFASDYCIAVIIFQLKVQSLITADLQEVKVPFIKLNQNHSDKMPCQLKDFSAGN